MNTESIFPILCELLLKSAAILALAGLACGLWRGASAASRHMIWAAALTALLALPLTKLATPLWTVEWGATPPATTVEPMAVMPVTPAIVAPAVSQEVLTEKSWSLPPWRGVLVALWLAGVVSLLGYRAMGSLRLRRLQRHSELLADPRAQILARSVAADCGLAGAIELRRAPACRVPLAWGLWRPVVLLPDEAIAWPDQRLAAALRHEFGHLRRRDCLARLVSQMACAVYWMNPLVWLAARRLRVAQEQACDDLVLRSGASAPDYADLLMQVARGLGANRLVRRHALAMAHPSTLEARVQAIVDPRRNRGPLTRGTMAFGAVTAAALVAASALAQVQEKTGAQVNDSKGITASTPAQVQDKAGAKESKPQIMVEAKIIEMPAGLVAVLQGKSLFNTAEAQAIFQKISATLAVDMLCSPRLTLLPDQQAKIEVVSEIPIGKDGSKTVKEGVSLDVLPKLRKDGKIEMDLTATLTVRQRLPNAREPLTEKSFKESNINVTATLTSGQTLAASSEQGAAKGRTLLLLLTASVVPGGGGEEKAKRIMVPLVDFRDAPLNEVVDFLYEQSRRLDPEKAGVHIWPPPAPPDGKWPRITLNLHDVSLLDAARYAANAAGMKLEAEETFLRLSSAQAPITAPPRPAAQPSAAAEKAKRITVARVDFQEAPLEDVVEFLKDESRELDPEKKGVNILLHAPPATRAAKITLQLRDVPLFDAVRYTADIAGLKLTAGENVLLLSPAKVPAVGTLPSAARSSVAGEKARRIVVPLLDFKDAPLNDVLAFLDDQDRELDPDKKGVNILLQAPPGAKLPTITLNLRNIPLLEALGYIAQLADCELAVDDHALRLVPKSAK